MKRLFHGYVNIEQCQLWTSIVIQVLKFNLIFISWMGCGLQGAEWSRWQTGSDWEVGRELSLPWALLVRSYHHRCLLFCPNFSVSLAPLPPEWPSVLILATVLLSTTHECFAFGSQLLNLALRFSKPSKEVEAQRPSDLVLMLGLSF